MNSVSVVIPTHNPRPDYMQRVLDALKRQTLDYRAWELVLVDNKSEQILSENYDLSWHPRSRHIREERLGLTPARLAGISASSCDIVVFVDDDNELFPDYLEQAMSIGNKHPYIGVWGGQIYGDFEDPDNFWAQHHPSSFTVRQFTETLWTNRKRDYSIMPIGAGMCARTELLRNYARLCQADERRLILDRTGSQLLTCGDLDIVFSICDLGFGKGLFPSLKLNHLIPLKRMTEDFVVRNAEGNQYSATIQNFLLDNEVPNQKLTWAQRLNHLYRCYSSDPLTRKIILAASRGSEHAMRDMQKWGWTKQVPLSDPTSTNLRKN
jgi:glycosyltransferase involved in cell wall biosynthesis